ncbi:MAG: NADPH-dependent glutamate synthase [Coriobacteriia bacterium]|nr:NADPH-dependent glutamate synthase [Coriobacteriia bacterium]MCL2537416.1 NADPH-dependent glutamate synthase [Coriobacteriia bacterium]
MANQPAEERISNFQEVALGYTLEQARAEAERCLQCKNAPCEAGCPVEVRIHDFISAIIDNDLPEAVAILKERNALPAVCGRVCPQESQCEATCVLARRGEPVAIGRLERFLADWDRQRPEEERNKTRLAPCKHKRIAVIGSGPAGLAAAGELSLRGYYVEVFEALHSPGGVLAYGIPEFRLPNYILEDEVEALRQARVTFHMNAPIGTVASCEELLDEGFNAVFIGVGAGLPKFMDIPGENLNGVYSANEFLTRVNLMHAYEFPRWDTPVQRGRQVVVIGGGNVAMDAARTALRLGAEEVTLAYRRTQAEMPARIEEVEHAIEEGVKLVELASPLEVVGQDGWVTGLRLQKMELGRADASGRRRPIPVEGEEYVHPADTVVSAIGTLANPHLREVADVDINQWGYLSVGEDGQTSNPRIFAGGDIVTGSATVIEAMGAGKSAAIAIDELLSAPDVQTQRRMT